MRQLLHVPRCGKVWTGCVHRHQERQENERLGAKALEDEARRAYEGSLRPIFYKGNLCDKIREYPDTLLICLLKAHFPDKHAERRHDEFLVHDIANRLDKARKRVGKA